MQFSGKFAPFFILKPQQADTQVTSRFLALYSHMFGIARRVLGLFSLSKLGGNQPVVPQEEQHGRNEAGCKNYESCDKLLSRYARSTDQQSGFFQPHGIGDNNTL